MTTARDNLLRLEDKYTTLKADRDNIVYICNLYAQNTNFVDDIRDRMVALLEEHEVVLDVMLSDVKRKISEARAVVRREDDRADALAFAVRNRVLDTDGETLTEAEIGACGMASHMGVCLHELGIVAPYKAPFVTPLIFGGLKDLTSSDPLECITPSVARAIFGEILPEILACSNIDEGITLPNIDEGAEKYFGLGKPLDHSEIVDLDYPETTDFRAIFANYDEDGHIVIPNVTDKQIQEDSALKEEISKFYNTKKRTK